MGRAHRLRNCTTVGKDGVGSESHQSKEPQFRKKGLSNARQGKERMALQARKAQAGQLGQLD